MKPYYALKKLIDLIDKCGLPLFVQRWNMEDWECFVVLSIKSTGVSADGIIVNYRDYMNHTRPHYSYPAEINLNESVFINHGFDLPPEYRAMLSQFNEKGYNPLCFGRDGYDYMGYDAYGFSRFGTDRESYDRDGFDADGYDRRGYDKDGYDINGYDRDGYGKAGYNREGYDRCGYNKEGFDEKGYGRDGFDREGYDKHGYNREGRNKADFVSDFELDYDNSYETILYLLKEDGSVDKDGYRYDKYADAWLDEDGYDRSGYDGCGYDRDGYDYYGYNRDGLDRNGCKPEVYSWKDVAVSKTHADYSDLNYWNDENDEDEINEYGMPLYEEDPYENGPTESEEEFGFDDPRHDPSSFEMFNDSDGELPF